MLAYRRPLRTLADVIASNPGVDRKLLAFGHALFWERGDFDTMHCTIEMVRDAVHVGQLYSTAHVRRLLTVNTYLALQAGTHRVNSQSPEDVLRYCRRVGCDPPETRALLEYAAGSQFRCRGLTRVERGELAAGESDLREAFARREQLRSRHGWFRAQLEAFDPTLVPCGLLELGWTVDTMAIYLPDQCEDILRLASAEEIYAEAFELARDLGRAGNHARALTRDFRARGRIHRARRRDEFIAESELQDVVDDLRQIPSLTTGVVFGNFWATLCLALRSGGMRDFELENTAAGILRDRGDVDQAARLGSALVRQPQLLPNLDGGHSSSSYYATGAPAYRDPAIAVDLGSRLVEALS